MYSWQQCIRQLIGRLTLQRRHFRSSSCCVYSFACAPNTELYTRAALRECIFIRSSSPPFSFICLLRLFHTIFFFFCISFTHSFIRWRSSLIEMRTNEFSMFSTDIYSVYALEMLHENVLSFILFGSLK